MRRLIYIWTIWAVLACLAPVSSVRAEKRSGTEMSEETEESTTKRAKEGIEISESRISVEIGDTRQLYVVGLPSGVKVRWSSGNEDRATVNKNGVVKARKAGKVKITAALSTGKNLTCAVTIPAVELNRNSIALAKGKTAKLKVKGSRSAVSWRSSKNSVARVDENGRVQAVKYGKAQISAKIGATTLKCQVAVLDPAIDKKEVYLLRGDSVKVQGKQYQGAVKWSVKDKEIASVTSRGVVTARREGKTKLLMKANGVTVSCPITVTTFRLSETEWKMTTGEKKKLKVTGTAKKKGKWTSSDPRRMTVSDKGVCEAIKCGDITVTYTVGDSHRSCHFLIADQKAVDSFGEELAQRPTGISSLRDRALGSESRYRYMQGGCTDGTYGYFILSDEHYEPFCALIKIRLRDWKIMDRKTGLKLYHGSDMAYDSRRKHLVVMHGNGDQTGLSYVDPDTLEITGTVHLDSRVYGVAYDEKTNRFAVAVAERNKIEVRDANWNLLYTFGHLKKDDYKRQGLDCDHKNIFILQSGMENSRTRIMVYDWSGHYRTEVYIRGYREAENLFHVGNRFIVSYNNYVYGGGSIYETALRRYYQIRMVSGEGRGKNVIFMVKNGEKVKLPACTFTGEDSVFRGWKVYRCSDDRMLYRDPDSGDVRWYSEEEQPEGWQRYLIPDRKKVSSFSDKPGDCITLTAVWE